jgi:cytidylate kinase
MYAAETPVIAVDGPSGAGKGTVGLWLAQRLDWHFLDSGALYRVLAVAAEQAAVPLDDAAGVAALAADLPVAFAAAATGADGVAVLLGGEDVTALIRTEACGNQASTVAAHPPVRAALLERQRRFRQAPGLVADGRDMGSVVFPDAQLKLFIDARPEVRAERRYKQLKAKGMDVNLAQLVRDIAERDVRDRTRSVAPLVASPDAVVVDTSDMDVEAVRQAVWSHAAALLR